MPANGEWRWLEHRADSPWYPTARLFRQREVGDWREAIDEVREALAAAPTRVRAKSRPVARKLETAEKESAVTPQPQAERKPGHKPARKRARVRAVAGESTANTASGDLVDQMDNPAVPPTLTPDPP